MKSKILLACILLVLMSLAACVSSSNQPFSTGKFIKSGAIDEGFMFNEDGTFSRFSNIFIYVKGTYSVDGNVYTEKSNNSNGNCETNMDFKYTFDGKNLTFKYIGKPEDDACQERRSDFDNVTYILSE